MDVKNWTAIDWIAIIGAAAWIPQIITWIYQYFSRNKIKRYLKEELKDIKKELQRTLHIFSRQLQIYALKCIDNGSPICLTNHIFKNYYKDAVLLMNSNQRRSFQMIHSYINTINENINHLNKISHELHKKYSLNGPKSITEQEGDLYGNAIKAAYTNTATAIWHINFHLNNSENPDLEAYTTQHEQYLKYLEDVEKNVIKIIDGAKKLSRKDFEKIYDPENFHKMKIARR